MMKKISASLAAITVIAAGAVMAYQATRSASGSDNEQLSVSATFYPLYDFARQVGGDKVSVVNITPAGAEPHDYEPSPRELIAALESDVFIYNGGQMEPWVESFLNDYSHLALKASSGIALLEADHGHEDDEAHDHDHGLHDPHFWLDPVLAQQIVMTIRDGFIQADPANAEYYTANAASYNQKLAKLHRDYTEGLAHCTLHTAISSHSAFSYLAHRYGFTVAPIAGIEPDQEPSVARMAELTNLVRREGIRYIFFESLVSPRLADTIADETGAQTLVFDPIEGLSQADQDKGRDYIRVQQDNLKNLKTALECK